MASRVLIDETLDAETVELLRESGHEAVHVSGILGKGTDHPTIIEYARANDYLSLTNYTDFLQRNLHPGIRVLYVEDMVDNSDLMLSRPLVSSVRITNPRTAL